MQRSIYQTSGYGFGLYNFRYPKHWFELKTKWKLISMLIGNKN